MKIFYHKLPVVRCTTLFLLANFLLTLPSPIQAHNESDLFQLPLEEILNIEIQSSTRQTESWYSAPNSVSIFSREQIQSMGIHHLAPLLNFAPGFQAYRGDTNASQWVMTARGLRSSYSSREILFLLDGVRINDDIAGGLFHERLLDIDNSKQVEVIRGPGSALHGANAYMGVVNIVSSDKNKLEARVDDQGSRAVYGNGVYKHGKFKAKLYSKFEDYRAPEQHLYNTQSPDQWPTASANYCYKSLYGQVAYGGSQIKYRHQEMSEEAFYIQGLIDPKNQLKSQSQFLDFSHKTHLSNTQWHLHSQATWFNRTYYGLIVNDSSSDPDAYLEAFFDETELNARVEAKYTSDTTRLLLGAEARNIDHYDNRGVLGTSAGDQAFKAAMNGQRDIQGYYLQWQNHPTNQLNIIAGLRLDDYSDFGQHLSPRLGLIVQTAENRRIKLLYSEAFRAPNWNELYAQNNPFIEANSELEPELNQTLELIWLYAGDNTRLSLTAFNTQIDNAIATVPGESRRSNFGSTSISGFEVEYQRSFLVNWSVRNTLSLMPNRARWSFSESNRMASSAILFNKGRMTASVNAYLHSQKRSPAIQSFNDDEILSPNSNVKLYAGLRINHELSAYVEVDNIFDSEQRRPAETPGNQYGVPLSGRSVQLGLRWTPH